VCALSGQQLFFDWRYVLLTMPEPFKRPSWFVIHRCVCMRHWLHRTGWWSMLPDYGVYSMSLWYLFIDWYLCHWRVGVHSLSSWYLFRRDWGNCLCGVPDWHLWCNLWIMFVRELPCWYLFQFSGCD
jgi:hypothetical protein